MKKIWLALLAASLLPALAQGHDPYRLEKSDTTSRVLRFASPDAAKTVKVDNVIGSITVSGGRTAEARLQAKKTLRADSQEDLQKADREVTLRITETDNAIDIYVDGPFRHRDGATRERRREYAVAYDLELQVPEQATLVLSTVTDGDIVVRDVRGEMTLRNVNGSIELRNVAGTVSGRTVNGRIRASFQANPAAACSFATVNGDLDLYFPAALAAEFRMKTMNGGIYSDFPVQALAAEPGAPKHEGGRFVYRSRGFQGVRVGSGGPEVRLETLNGDIMIADNKKINSGE
jgi:hypothetical protein